MAPLALVEPEDPLGAEHPLGHLVIEEVLELAQREGALAGEGEGGEALDRLVVGMGAVIVIVMVAMIVVMALMTVIGEGVGVIAMTVIGVSVIGRAGFP